MSKPKKKYRELDSRSKWNRALENKGIYIDDELGSKSIAKLIRAFHLNQNKDE